MHQCINSPKETHTHTLVDAAHLIRRLGIRLLFRQQPLQLQLLRFHLELQPSREGEGNKDEEGEGNERQRKEIGGHKGRAEDERQAKDDEDEDERGLNGHGAQDYRRGFVSVRFGSVRFG